MEDDDRGVTVSDRRKWNFFQVNNEILDNYDLSLGAYWLYSKILRHSGVKDCCFLSLNRLAKDCRLGGNEASQRGVSRQSIINWRQQLIDKKLIRVERRESQKVGHAMTWYIVCDIEKTSPPLSNQVDKASQRDLTPLVNSGLPPLVNLNCHEEYISTEEYKEKKKPANPPSAYSQEFLLFWQAYPTGCRGKAGKGAAYKSWQRQKLNKHLPEVIAALAKWKKSDQWTKDFGAYIPNPATWLNQKRWEDELPKEANGPIAPPDPAKISDRESELYRRYDPSLRTQ
jgi:hypothetical protein